MTVEALKAKPLSLYRWAILCLASSMMIANYYCYDIPAALHEQMKNYMGNPSNFESYHSLLYSLYSFPNIILPFFGGYFVDKFGVRVCLVVFSCFIAVGQFIFALGLSLKSWPVMFIGRFVFGLGGENMAVANSAVLTSWFIGKELAFAFGLNLSVSRLGSVINNIASPALAADVDIQFAFWFGTILCGFSVFATLVIFYIDKTWDAAERRTGLSKPLLNTDEDDVLAIQPLIQDGQNVRPLLQDGEQNTSNPLVSEGALEKSSKALKGDLPTELEDESPQHSEFWECLKFKEAFWLLAISCLVVYGCVLPFNNIASGLLLERSYFQEPSKQCHLQHPGQCQNSTNIPVDCPLYYSSSTNQPPLPTFIDKSSIDCTQDSYSTGCTEIYCSRLTDAEILATQIMSIPYIISAVLSPFLGAAVDIFGQRAVVAALCPAALIIVHSLLGFTDVDPVGPLVGQGLAYSGFAAVLWPSVPLVIPDKAVGLGFGVITAIQNGGLTAFPQIIAAIYSDDGDKFIPDVEYFFVSLALVGFIIGVYLNYYDYYHDNVLNSPGDDGAATWKSIKESFKNRFKQIKN